MDREIKFRLLDIETKIFFKDIALEFKLNTPFYNVLDKDEVILMQYTGLKDKNGVEIYEGDIVRNGLDNIFPERNNIAEIKFGECLTNSEYEVYGYYFSNYLDDTEILTSYRAKECEVIGNIYQNPELLK